MPNLTRIPGARVPVLDATTGLMSREWYRYLFNQFQLLSEVIGVSGAVNQLTAKSYPVTLNTISGQIVMDADPLGAGASVTFTLNNSLITSRDTVIAVMGANGASYSAAVVYATDGAAQIRITNTTAGSLAEQPVVNFAVVKSISP